MPACCLLVDFLIDAEDEVLQFFLLAFGDQFLHQPRRGVFVGTNDHCNFPSIDILAIGVANLLLQDWRHNLDLRNALSLKNNVPTGFQV